MQSTSVRIASLRVISRALRDSTRMHACEEETQEVGSLIRTSDDSPHHHTATKSEGVRTMSIVMISTDYLYILFFDTEIDSSRVIRV